MFLAALMLGLSVLLALTAGISWKRSRSLKIALVAAAMAFFTLKALYLLWSALVLGVIPEDTLGLTLDVVIISFLYLSILK